jgi:Zn-dependent peptidase ImmA (M78 family)
MSDIDNDLKKLDAIEERGRSTYGNDRLSLLDIYVIETMAERFGVPRISAYHRAKSLGLLSYQKDGGKG